MLHAVSNDPNTFPLLPEPTLSTLRLEHFPPHLIVSFPPEFLPPDTGSFFPLSLFVHGHCTRSLLTWTNHALLLGSSGVLFLSLRQNRSLKECAPHVPLPSLSQLLLYLLMFSVPCGRRLSLDPLPSCLERLDGFL